MSSGTPQGADKMATAGRQLRRIELGQTRRLNLHVMPNNRHEAPRAALRNTRAEATPARRTERLGLSTVKISDTLG